MEVKVRLIALRVLLGIGILMFWIPFLFEIDKLLSLSYIGSGISIVFGLILAVNIAKNKVRIVFENVNIGAVKIMYHKEIKSALFIFFIKDFLILLVFVLIVGLFFDIYFKMLPFVIVIHSTIFVCQMQILFRSTLSLEDQFVRVEVCVVERKKVNVKIKH